MPPHPPPGANVPPGDTPLPEIELTPWRLLHALPIGLCHLSPERRILRANPALARMLGRPVGSALEGERFEAVAPPEAVLRLEEYLRAPAGSPTWECRWPAADGAELFVEVTVLTADAGAVVLALADRTDHRLREASRQQSHQYQGLATLADGFAHEFNNVLAIIMGHASLLRDVTSDRQRVIQIGEIIMEASRRGTGIVRQVALFAGQHGGDKERLDLHQLINRLLDGRQWPEAVTVVRDLRARDPHLLGIAGHIEQCLDCLVANALDAIPQGGTLTVTTDLCNRLPRGHPGAPAPFLQLTVADTGRGMDRITQSRIFEPFFVGDANPRRRGLGMAVVYGIVRSHHGFIEIDSAVGAGTRVNIFLPVPPAEAPVRPLGASNPPMARPVDAAAQRRTVLMVEDEPDIGTLMTAIFRKHGISVMWARDGEEGLRLYRRHSEVIGAVFTDVGLPGMDGWELCKQLRAIAPAVPLVVASGYLRGGSEAEKAVIPSLFLIKPYDHNEVVTKIAQFIGRTGAGSASPL